ncbi:MAG: hypothetical protein WCH39_15680 [Schlesneria sp.]
MFSSFTYAARRSGSGVAELSAAEASFLAGALRNVGDGVML